MIIPALLTDQKKMLQKMLALCATFTDYAQIDIMDGVFVPSRSVSIHDLAGLTLPLGCEAHLMVSDPSLWIEPFQKLGVRRLIYHREVSCDHSALIAKIKKAGMSVGLAVNPSTPLKALESFAAKVDTVLFMAVNPGFYGAEFIPQVLEKVRLFKKKFPSLAVGIDGGIKIDNVHLAKEAGCDYICVGSAILNSPDPEAAYAGFAHAVS